MLTDLCVGLGGDQYGITLVPTVTRCRILGDNRYQAAQSRKDVTGDYDNCSCRPGWGSSSATCGRSIKQAGNHHGGAAVNTAVPDASKTHPNVARHCTIEMTEITGVLAGP